MRTQLCLPLVAVSFALLTVPVSADTIHVPSDQPTIQAGIDAASAGDTVLVACGTYYEHDIEMKSGVYLTSETGLADCVTVDAQQLGGVFYCDGVDSLASIVGFTITGGYSHAGGGVHCSASSLTLADCALVGNTASEGGGMRCVMDSHTTLTGCTVSGNTAVFGGGVILYSSPAVLTDCTVSGNVAESGGGMVCYYSSCPSLTRVTLAHNSASLLAGGMYCVSSSIPLLTDCIIAFSTSGEAVVGFAIPTCCDFYGNAGGDWVGDVAGWYGINGNFSEDPLFCLEDAPDQPYSLHEGSPCLPENSPCGELVGALGLGCGPVSPVEATSWGAIKAMYR